MTINISFSDTIVRVSVELNGGIESAITELPQREWVGLTDEEVRAVIRAGEYDSMEEFARAIEAKLKDKNT